jgi:hypothetical protein
MPDTDNEQKPRSRRPSYLGGPAGPAKAPVAPARPSQVAPPKREEPPPPIEDKEILRWKVWLLPRRPWVSAAVVATVVASVGLAYWAVPNAFFVIAITLILLTVSGPSLFSRLLTSSRANGGNKTLFAPN